MSSFDKTPQAKVTIYFPNGESRILEADPEYTMETEEDLYGDGYLPKLDFVELERGKRITTSGLPYLIERDVQS